MTRRLRGCSGGLSIERIDLFGVAIFAWVAPIFANLHSAITQRAFALTVKNVKQKTSIALSRPVAYHTEVQHSIAEAVHESPAMEESTPLCSPEQGR